MVSNRTLIIECGARRVALAAFSYAGHRLRLHKFAAEPFVHQADAPAAGDDPWLKNTCDGLLSLARQTGMRGPVTLVLPAHLTLAKAIKLPRVETAQREKILHFEAGQAIPYALSDVVWDSVAVFETATDLEVLLATAKLEVFDPLCSAAYDAGFEPNLILPSPFATLAGFRLLQDFPGQGFLGLNLGMRSTTLVLFESGRFAFRTFALGLGESEGPAGPQPATEKADATRARLLQEITRSLLHFQWRSGMGKPNHVCVTDSPVKKLKRSTTRCRCSAVCPSSVVSFAAKARARRSETCSSLSPPTWSIPTARPSNKHWQQLQTTLAARNSGFQRTAAVSDVAPSRERRDSGRDTPRQAARILLPYPLQKRYRRQFYSE